MNDLIRREDVLKLFPINDCSDKMIGLYERVLDIPIAYDAEKVVAELEEKMVCGGLNVLVYNQGLSDAIDIVKRGGVE